GSSDVCSSDHAEDEDKDEPQRAFLERQQLELFEHVRRDSIAEARADSIRALVRADEPDTVRLARNEEVDELVPTRDGSWILVRTETPTEDERQTIVPDWVTDDGYTSTLTVRTKVGDEPDGARIGVLETATGSVRWLRVTPEDYEGDGPPQVSNMGWNDAGTKAFLFVVSFDAKDRFL